MISSSVGITHTATPLSAELTANNVGVWAHRARAALRRQMQTRCMACPDPCSLSDAAAARDPLRRVRLQS